MEQNVRAGAAVPGENKMGVMPVRRLLVTMSLPMMISMLVQALYNVVDSIFVARIEEDALTAVTLAFPMQNLMIALGAGIGVGINALLSRSLGEKRYDKVNQSANTGLLITFVHFVVFLLAGLFLAGPFLRTQTSDEKILEYGHTYLRIVSCCSFGLFFQITFERLLQSTGRTLYSMISQATGAIINIILDPIMIFGLLGCPQMGVTGAAVATVIGQCCAAGIGLALNLTRNPEIRFSLQEILRPDMDTIRQIYEVGIPSVLMMAIGSVMSYLMNRILIVFSTTATAVFGAYFKLQSFFFMPVIGLNNGMIPIIAYNYGADRKDRIRATLKFALLLAFGIMCVGTFIFEVFPGQLLDLFNASADMKDLGIPALRIIAIHFPLAAVGITLGATFQAFAKSVYSMIISLCRQLVVLIPVAWLLAQLGNVDYVWLSFLAAELVSLALSLYFYRRLAQAKDL